MHTTRNPQSTIRVDLATGRFILRNEGKHANVLLKRSAPGWGGTPSTVLLRNRAEVRAVHGVRAWRACLPLHDAHM